MKHRAFTVMELLLSLVLIALLSITAGPFMSAFFGDWELENDRARLHTDIVSARYMAFLEETSETLLLSGTSYTCPDGAVVQLASGHSLTYTTAEIKFNSLGGLSGPLEFTLSSAARGDRKFSINSLGKVDTD